MREYDLPVLALQETRWLGSGLLTDPASDTKYLFSGGAVGGDHERGVAVALDKKGWAAYVAAGEVFEGVSDRLMRVRLRIASGYLSLIVVYAPTCQRKHKGATGDFYVQLEALIDSCPNKDMKVVMGDFNAVVGKGKLDDDVVGPYLSGNRNANGIALLDMCRSRNFFIANSGFSHLGRQLLSYRSPKGKKRCIDHILVDRRFINSTVDSRVYRGACIDSDHFLLTATFKLSLRGPKRGKPSEATSNVPSLSDVNADDDLKEEFLTLLKDTESKFAEVRDDASIKDADKAEALWTCLRDGMSSALCSLDLGKRKRNKPWVSKQLLVLIGKRQEAWKKGDMVLYKQLRKAVNRVAKTCKQNFFLDQGKAVEQAARNGSSMFYRIIRENKRRPLKPISHMLAEDKTKIFSKGDKLRRWAAYFKGLLCTKRKVAPDLLSRLHKIPQLTPIDSSPPTDVEVAEALGRMRGGSAPGCDQISANALKLGGETVASMLGDVFRRVWETLTMPKDFVTQEIITIFKKGDRMDCGNYRGISLLCVACKVLGRLILSRISKSVDTQLLETQAGFRATRGCVEQIFCLRMVAERYWEFRIPLFLVFVDLAKAYDTVDRETLWCIMKEHYAIPEQIVNVLKAIHTGNIAKIKMDGDLSDSFDIDVGVRQGDVPAPTLFNLFFDSLIRRYVGDLQASNIKGAEFRCREKGYLIKGAQSFGPRCSTPLELHNLMYADDLGALSTSYKDAVRSSNILERLSSDQALDVSNRKTELLIISNPKSDTQPGHCPNYKTHPDKAEIKVVKHFKYLGSTLSSDLSLDAEVDHRIKSATKAFGAACFHVWNNKSITKHTKLRFFRYTILPRLLYSAETWTALRPIEMRLQAQVMRWIRYLMKVSLYEKRTNVEVRRMANIWRVDSILMHYRLRWLGHLLRLDNDRFARKLLICKPVHGSRARGGPRTRWCDLLKKDLEMCGLPAKVDANLIGLTQDRTAWKNRIKDAVNKVNKNREDAETKKRTERKERDQSQHKDMLPFVCSICNKGCRNKRGLQQHMGRHERENISLKCPICGADGLKNIQIHQNKNGTCRQLQQNPGQS